MTLISTACTHQNKVLVSAGSENWGEHHAGDTVTLHQEFKIYAQGKDTLIYFTNYYTNGKLKSKVMMKNDLLWEIQFVMDSLGNKKKFGSLKHGNGSVIEYSDDKGEPEQKGKFIKGNREGWWINYHFTGSILDSTLYKEGYNISSPASNNVLEKLIGSPGSVKYNYYR